MIIKLRTYGSILISKYDLECFHRVTCGHFLQLRLVRKTIWKIALLEHVPESSF